MPDTMILDQAVLQLYFAHRVALLYKMDIIQPNTNRILPNINQVIYILDTIWTPNIIILTQADLQIFCSQGPLWAKFEKGNSSVKYSQNFMKN